MADDNSTSTLPRIGTRVEVRVRYDGTWSPGFEVAGIEDDGYRIKRMTDGTVLPSLFGDDEVRREPSRPATW